MQRPGFTDSRSVEGFQARQCQGTWYSGNWKASGGGESGIERVVMGEHHTVREGACRKSVAPQILPDLV